MSSLGWLTLEAGLDYLEEIGERKLALSAEFQEMLRQTKPDKEKIIAKLTEIRELRMERDNLISELKAIDAS